MVALEEEEGSGNASDPGSGSLYAHWKDEWIEVDQQLADLASSDFEAYSDMMMNSQITLNLPGRFKKAFYQTVENLIKQLTAKRRSSKDLDLQKSLDFEISGLRLIKK